MAKSKKLELPPTPTYQANPNLNSNITFGSQTGKQLIQGDYSGFGGLQDATSLHPQNTQLALSAAQGFLQPQYEQTIRDATNSAAANNQLNSSTFTDALARNAQTLNSQYQGIASQAALTDAQTAQQNRIGLFKTGIDTLNQFTGAAQNQTNSENSFNLDNYSNLVAKAIQDNKNVNQANPFQQILSLGSPIGHDYFKSQGVENVPGYGVADVAKMASLFTPGGGGGFNSMGNGFGNQNASVFSNSGKSAPFAGAYALNDLNPDINKKYRGF